MSNLNSIDGVEIFASGKWNGDEFTNKDLDQMVEAFEIHKDKLKPHLKLGHTEDQKLLQNDGLPAAGWIQNLRRIGDKLVADFIDIPNKIYELIENKAFRKVSSEIYFDIEIEGTTYPRMLSAVALLGQDMPAVTTLNDILAMYKNLTYDRKRVFELDKNEHKTYNYEKQGANMPETQVEKVDLTELEAKLAEATAKNAELEAKFADTEAQLKDKEEGVKELSEKVETLEKENFSAKEKAEKAELEAWVSGLTDVTPAMKPFAMELLGPEKKEYSVGKDKLDKRELFKEIIKLSKAADVNFDESSEEGKEKKDDLLSKVDKYALENECDYRTAYIACLEE